MNRLDLKAALREVAKLADGAHASICVADAQGSRIHPRAEQLRYAQEKLKKAAEHITNVQSQIASELETVGE